MRYRDGRPPATPTPRDDGQNRRSHLKARVDDNVHVIVIRGKATSSSRRRHIKMLYEVTPQFKYYLTARTEPAPARADAEALIAAWNGQTVGAG